MRTPTPLCVLLSRSDLIQPWRVQCRVGKGASLGRATRANSRVRLCPRCPISPIDRVGKVARGQAISPRLWQATLPTLLPRRRSPKNLRPPCHTSRIDLVMSFGNGPDEGDDHDTATEHVCRRARANEIVA